MQNSYAMKRILTALGFLLLSLFAPAQDSLTWKNRHRNALEGNLFGNATTLSIDYERILLNQERFFLIFKTGIGLSLVTCQDCDDVKANAVNTFPLVLTGNSGKGRNYFEYGIGYTFVMNPSLENYLYAILGYRHLPKKSSGAIFKLFISRLLIQEQMNSTFIAPIGISFGVGF